MGNILGFVIGAGIIGAIVYIMVNKKKAKKGARPPLSFDAMLGFSEYTALDLPTYNFVDQMADRGFNLTRVFLMDVWQDASNPVEHTQCLPWLKVNGKFDLLQFDPEYFKKLKAFTEKCRTRGVIIVYAVFDDCGLRYPGLFNIHPFKKDNNVQGWFSNNAYEMYNTNNAQAMQVEEAFIDKVMETIGDYENVIYEYSNEPSHANMKWAEKMKAIIEGKHGKAGKTLYSEHGVAQYHTHHNINNKSQVGEVRPNWIYSSDGKPRGSSLKALAELIKYARAKNMCHEWYYPQIITGNGDLDPETLAIIDSI